MSIQVLAVRLDGGNSLVNILELIYGDDDDGTLGYMDRASFAAVAAEIRPYLWDTILG